MTQCNIANTFLFALASSTDLAMVPELMGAPGHITNHWDHLQKPENRRFTYQELEKFTENFKHLIGHGGFGHVYYGCLEDSTEVAVKMRSKLSSHGLNEFLAEVTNSVTTKFTTDKINIFTAYNLITATVRFHTH